MVTPPPPSPRRPLIARLSSLAFGAGLMAALVPWLALGIGLTRHEATAPVFKAMNDRLFLSWFQAAAFDQPLIGAWLLVLFVLSGLLLVNLICCCLYLPALKPRPQNRSKPLLLLILHLLVGLVMIGHVANMTVGYKTARIKLLPGQSAPLPDGRQLRLEALACSFPPTLMNSEREQIRQKMTRDRVRLDENHADFTILQDGQSIDAGRAFLLRPYRRGAFRVTLNRFFPAGPASDAAAETATGAIVTVAENPLHEPFFVLYAIMIVCFMIYWAIIDFGGKKQGPRDNT